MLLMKIQACVLSILDWWGRSLIGMGHCISKKSITQCKDCIKTREHDFQQSKYHCFSLVGGLEYDFFDFPYLSIIYGITQLTHIFQRGRAQPPTSHCFLFTLKFAGLGSQKIWRNPTATLESHGWFGDVLVSGHRRSPQRSGPSGVWPLLPVRARENDKLVHFWCWQS